jgi:L-lactate dehydrogenase complex protein LldG
MVEGATEEAGEAAMSGAREAILERIRASIGPVSAKDDEIPRTYIRKGSLSAEARLAMFLERLHEYDANVVETDAAGMAEAIGSVLRAHEQKSAVVANGFPVEALPEGFVYTREENADIDDLDRCEGIITKCFVGIAFTGSIVLTHGPGEGARRLTLLPDRHLCVVRADQVVETVPEAMDRLAEFATSPITFISGPSATADIEMTRIRGVHGPRFLDVVLVT